MIPMRKLFQEIIDNEELDDTELLYDIYYLAKKLNWVEDSIYSDLVQLTYHLAKILFCNDQTYEYWVKEITNKYLNVFPLNKLKGKTKKINQKILKRIIKKFKEFELTKTNKILSKANCDVPLTNTNQIKLKHFINKFFDEYLKTFEYNKRYSYEEIDNIIQTSMGK